MHLPMEYIIRVKRREKVRTINCDGCGMKEPVDTPKDEKQISPVKFIVVIDPRYVETNKTYEADLCDDCEGRVLHKFFNVSAQGRLSTPAFIDPSPADHELRVAQ